MLKPTDPCSTCLGFAWSRQEFVPASGTGENGVLVVAEAAGEQEAAEGMPLIGKAGHYLWSNLARAGVQREGFKIHNVLSCRPPQNKLAKTVYEEAVIAHCSPLLDATLTDMQGVCASSGRDLTILTLGRTAFKRIMGLDDKHPIMKEDYLSYPFRSEKYQAWVVAGDHPSYLMRGNNHLLPVLQFAARRATEIAAGGFKYAETNYLRDPAPPTFGQWVADYIAWADSHPETYLAFDIETPHKQGKDEEKVAKEDDDDYTILRCSFAYRPGHAVSVPWRAEYLPYLEQLFAHPGTKLVWNVNYDCPRISAQIPIVGDVWDAMLMWHVLNSALPKGLGFVTPFYCQDMPMWKHLSGSDPAGYNCQDSDALLRNAIGIRKDLLGLDLWKVFDRHVVQLNRVLGYMSSVGVLRDEAMRREAEVKLAALLDETEVKMEAAVPQEARKLKVFKKTPKDTTGMVLVEARGKISICETCLSWEVKAAHFKSIGKKRLAKGESENLCYPGKPMKVERMVQLWAQPLEFKVSKLGLQNYQKALRHQAIINRKENRVTFDVNAIEALMKKYPKDPLYPLILEHRDYQKLLSTYIGVTKYEEVEVPDDYVLKPGEIARAV